MKFAAGITISGIISFILLEVAKLLMPAIAAGIMAFVVLVLKAILIIFVIALAALAIGVGVFFYKRANRNRVEV